MNKDIGPRRKKVSWSGVVLVISLFCFLGTVCFVSAGQRQVKVRWVPDGDTLFLHSGARVRLRGVDAPEIGHDSQPSQYYAQRSRQILSSLVEGKTLLIDTNLKKDRFGRLLAYARLQNGQLLNKILLQQGCAFCCFSSDQSPLIQKRFLKAQRKAIANETGFWAKILHVPVANQKYRGNKRSLRFHGLQCPFGKKIHKQNRLTFNSLKEAFWAGFAPCRRCTPWPLFKHKPK